jgi:hypothetical protein
VDRICSHSGERKGESGEHQLFAVLTTDMALPITSAGRFSPFGPGGMARLPHGLSEMLRNRCHGTIDDDLMFLVEDNRDRFIINFNDKTNELRVNCDAFITPAYCQKSKVIYHSCAP